MIVIILFILIVLIKLKFIYFSKINFQKLEGQNSRIFMIKFKEVKSGYL